MAETIVINTDKVSFFRNYVMIKKPVLESLLSQMNGRKIMLPNKIIDLIALMLFQFSINYDADGDNSELFNHLLSSGSRKLYSEKLNIKTTQLNIYISFMRKIGILSGNTINKYFIVYPNGEEFDLTFKFKLNEVRGQQEDN
jgi:hypothetical protein